MLGFQNKRESTTWAKKLMAEHKEFFILDFETTDKPDFKKGYFPEPLSIAIIKCSPLIFPDNYTVIMNQLIKPKGAINPDAIAVHGITEDMLKDKPSFAEVYLDVAKTLHKEITVAYNAQFEQPVLEAVCSLYNLPCIQPRFSCAMMAYSAFDGERHPKYKNYIWHKLSAACSKHNIVTDNAHDALADVVMTYKLIEVIAKG